MILDIKIVDDEFSDEFEDDEDFAAGLQDRATKEANVNVEKKAGLEDVDEEEDEAIELTQAQQPFSSEDTTSSDQPIVNDEVNLHHDVTQLQDQDAMEQDEMGVSEVNDKETQDQLHEDESDMIVQDVVAHDHDTDDDETIGSTCHPDDVTEDHFHDDDGSSCREEVRVSDTEDGETRAPSTSHVTQGHLHEDESAMTEDHFHDDDGSSCQEEVRVSDTEDGETRAPSTSHVTQGHLHEDESAMTEDHFHDDDGSSCQEEVRVSDTEVGAIADQGTHSSEEEFDFMGSDLGKHTAMTHNAV